MSRQEVRLIGQRYGCIIVKVIRMGDVWVRVMGTQIGTTGSGRYYVLDVSLVSQTLTLIKHFRTCTSTLLYFTLINFRTKRLENFTNKSPVGTLRVKVQQKSRGVMGWENISEEEVWSRKVWNYTPSWWLLTTILRPRLSHPGVLGR